MTDQLKNIAQPGVLRYEFIKGGSLEEGFTDRVSLFITELKQDGTKVARVEFFTGERNLQVPEYESLTGNPILAVYLQGDVYEMNRLAGGNWRYFHRALKTAFQRSATVKPTTVTWAGKTVPAQEVFVRPYVNDPKRDKFAAIADKSYSVLLSDAVPGGLYSITTQVADPKAHGDEKAPPLLEETLRLVAVEPLPLPAAAVPAAAPAAKPAGKSAKRAAGKVAAKSAAAVAAPVVVE
jgi:hypothetical protein